MPKKRMGKKLIGTSKKKTQKNTEVLRTQPNARSMKGVVE